MQSKRMSMVETLVNQGTGYVLALAMNHYLIPWIYPTVRPSLKGSITLTVLFTAASVIRSYAFRRLFNYLAHVDGAARYEAFRADVRKVFGK